MKWQHLRKFAWMPTTIKYVQGQSPSPKIREYFYYIDHLGQLFLDDARMKNFTSCFKEKDFLEFFYKRLRTNDTGRYENEFPFLSLCGRERNFIRCDDRPIVYTHIFLKQPGPDSEKNSSSAEFLAYGNAGDRMAVVLEPENFYVSSTSGRLYYPAPDNVGGYGLVRSALADQLSVHFRFENGPDRPPTHIMWRERLRPLSNALRHLVR